MAKDEDEHPLTENCIALAVWKVNIGFSCELKATETQYSTATTMNAAIQNVAMRDKSKESEFRIPQNLRCNMYCRANKSRDKKNTGNMRCTDEINHQLLNMQQSTHCHLLH